MLHHGDIPEAAASLTRLAQLGIVDVGQGQLPAHTGLTLDRPAGRGGQHQDVMALGLEPGDNLGAAELVAAVVVGGVEVGDREDPQVAPAPA